MKIRPWEYSDVRTWWHVWMNYRSSHFEKSPRERVLNMTREIWQQMEIVWKYVFIYLCVGSHLFLPNTIRWRGLVLRECDSCCNSIQVRPWRQFNHFFKKKFNIHITTSFNMYWKISVSLVHLCAERLADVRGSEELLKGHVSSLYFPFRAWQRFKSAPSLHERLVVCYLHLLKYCA